MQFINIISSIILVGAIFCISFSIIGAIISSIELDKTIMNKLKDSIIPIVKIARISSLIRKGSFIIVFNQLLAALPIAILVSFLLSKTLRLGIIIGALFTAIIAIFCIFMCTISNTLTALRCATGCNDSLKKGFNTAYNAGGIIGTFLLGIVL
jgi:Na+/H+-translocating membrane pyrophosphatase